MKYAVIVMMFFCVCLNAQNERLGKSFSIPQPVHLKVKYDIRRAVVPAALCFVSGAAWGLHEKTAHHWNVFHVRFPNANPEFWNPAVSWETRQYLGYKFDAKHLLATTTQVTGFSAGVTIGFGSRRPWWHYALDAGLSFGAYTVGNGITFDLLYKK